jgi:hypothetical protein
MTVRLSSLSPNKQVIKVHIQPVKWRAGGHETQKIGSFGLTVFEDFSLCQGQPCCWEGETEDSCGGKCLSDEARKQRKEERNGESGNQKSGPGEERGWEEGVNGTLKGQT